MLVSIPAWEEVEEAKKVAESRPRQEIQVPVRSRDKSSRTIIWDWRLPYVTCDSFTVEACWT